MWAYHPWFSYARLPLFFLFVAFHFRCVFLRAAEASAASNLLASSPKDSPSTHGERLDQTKRRERGRSVRARDGEYPEPPSPKNPRSCQNPTEEESAFLSADERSRAPCSHLRVKCPSRTNPGEAVQVKELDNRLCFGHLALCLQVSGNPEPGLYVQRDLLSVTSDLALRLFGLQALNLSFHDSRGRALSRPT